MGGRLMHVLALIGSGQGRRPAAMTHPSHARWRAQAGLLVSAVALLRCTSPAEGPDPVWISVSGHITWDDGSPIKPGDPNCTHSHTSLCPDIEVYRLWPATPPMERHTTTDVTGRYQISWESRCDLGGGLNEVLTIHGGGVHGGSCTGAVPSCTADPQVRDCVFIR